MTREEKEDEMVLNRATSDTPPAFLVHAVDEGETSQRMDLAANWIRRLQGKE